MIYAEYVAAIGLCEEFFVIKVSLAIRKHGNTCTLLYNPGSVQISIKLICHTESKHVSFC